MCQRIQVAEEHRPATEEGIGSFAIYDVEDGRVLVKHLFPLGDAAPAWLRANRAIAQAIADALNGAPGAAIDHVRRHQRAADLANIRVNPRQAPKALSLAA
jgi:hypothetical protein